MASKKSVKRWVKLVKIAGRKNAQRRKATNEFNMAHDEIRLAVSINETYNTNMDKDLGKKWCEIRYCPEKWTGALLENDPNTQVHSCQNFSSEKCSINCPLQNANHKFIDAKATYEAAKRAHINSVKRVFGLRIK